MYLKIGIIAHIKHALREPFAGGLEMHTAFLAHALATRGHDVTIFGAGDGKPQLGIDIIGEETYAKDVGACFTYEHAAYLQLMQGLASADFDIVHNNSLHYLPIAMAGQLKIPVLTSLHTPPFWEVEGSIRLHRSPNLAFAAISPSIKRAWLPVTDVDFIVPNGIDLQKFAFRLHSDAARYLIWFGRIVPEKGLHLAIQAARIAGIPLYIAGPISDAVYFGSKIAPFLSGNVRYLGHLDHASLIHVIAGAAAFLCTPMWEEPYGLVVAESLACGTPVAAFARGALNDLIDESSGILVEPDNIAALARAAHDVQYLMREKCRARAEAICDADKMIEDYEALYVTLISKNQAACRVPATGDMDLWDVADRRELEMHYQSLPVSAAA